MRSNLRTKLMAATLAATAVLCGAEGARAAVFNVDFGAGGLYTGTAAAPDNGTTFNQVTGNVADVALVPSTGGSAGPVTITLSGSIGSYTVPVLDPSNIDPNNIPTESNPTPAGAFDNLTRDQVFTSFGTATVTLSGLTPTSTYNLYLYEVRGGAETTRFTVNRAVGPALFQDSTGDDGSTTGFNNPEDYVLFSGLMPQGANSNQIVFTFTGGPVGDGFNQYGALVALQLVEVPVPEPTSLALLGLAAAAAGRCRRRGR